MRIQIEITQAEVAAAAGRAAHTAMGFIISGFADVDQSDIDRFTRYNRLSEYLTICQGKLMESLQGQQDKAKAIMWGTAAETPDIFHLDGVRRKKKRTKTA